MSQTTPRPSIPEEIKRRVRQRCGFGCVLCGNPIIDYDHMHGFDPAKGHIEKELTLLCPEHHRDKTHGRLDLDTVLAANSSPYNIQNNASGKKRLEFRGNPCTIWLGNNAVTASLGEGRSVIAIGVDSIPLLAFRRVDDQLMSLFQIFNVYNEPVLRIIDNELRYYALPWDIRLQGNQLSIREGSGKYLVDLEFKMPNAIFVRRARMLCNGVEVVVTPSGNVVVGGMKLDGNTTNGAALLLIGPGWESIGSLVKFKQLDRYDPNSLGARTWESEAANSPFPDVSENNT